MRSSCQLEENELGAFIEESLRKDSPLNARSIPGQQAQIGGDPEQLKSFQ